MFCSSAQGVTAVDSALGSLQGPTSDVWGSRGEDPGQTHALCWPPLPAPRPRRAPFSPAW